MATLTINNTIEENLSKIFRGDSSKKTINCKILTAHNK